LRAHSTTVERIAFSADSSSLLTTSWDRGAAIWSAAEGERICGLQGHELSVLDAGFSPDGSRVLTASEDKTARLWSVSAPELIARGWASISPFRGKLGPETSQWLEAHVGLPAHRQRSTWCEFPPLHLVARSGNVPAAAALLDQGEPIDRRDKVNRTALHHAAERGHLDLVRLLLEQGASREPEDNEGVTPSRAAKAGDHDDVAAMLGQSLGKDPQARWP
jgi:hypothetical protein